MPLINCKTNLILTWSSTDEGTLAITDTRLYAPVVTLSIYNNTKLLKQLKSGVKRIINWNKYLAKKPIFRSIK